MIERDYGKIHRLGERVEKYRAMLCRPGSGMPFYGGLVKDLEVILRFLNAREFAEWLRVHGDSEQARFADEILEALEDQADFDGLKTDIEKALPVAEGQAYSDAVERSARLGDQVRDVLEECGALAKGDEATDIPALLRVLLS